MRDPHPVLWRGRDAGILAGVLVYAIGLWAAAHAAGHHFFSGWIARLATMGMVALGLVPWGRWLAPRVMWLLSLIGRATLVACYVVFFWPFAVLLRVKGDAMRFKRPSPKASLWVIRPARPATIDAARLES